MENQDLVRVQKIIADAGIASRRKAEELIERGAVTVNGNKAKLGDKANPYKDKIENNRAKAAFIDVYEHLFMPDKNTVKKNNKSI